jgi:hypothetical protein
MFRRLNTGASSAPAPVNGFGARMAAMLGLTWRGTLSPLAAASGPAEIMRPNWKPDGESVTLDLRVIIERRAETATSKSLRARFLKTHCGLAAIIANGR